LYPIHHHLSSSRRAILSGQWGVHWNSGPTDSSGIRAKAISKKRDRKESAARRESVVWVRPLGTTKRTQKERQEKRTRRKTRGLSKSHEGYRWCENTARRRRSFERSRITVKTLTKLELERPKRGGKSQTPSCNIRVVPIAGGCPWLRGRLAKSKASKINFSFNALKIFTRSGSNQVDRLIPAPPNR